MTRIVPPARRPLRSWAGVGAVAVALAAAAGGIASAQETPAAPARADAATDAAAQAATDAATDAYAGTSAATPPVPPELVPPAGHRLSSVFAAHGVQVYQCTATAWTLLEPAATLTGRTLDPPRRATAIHYRGPSWQSPADGSLVTGKAVATVPSPGTIAQLLIEAVSNRGDGVFGTVSYVQRLATAGGVAPEGACTDGATQSVPYRAVYRFFTPA